MLTGRPITGPELATLLEVLVSAANEGSLAEVGLNQHSRYTCTHKFKTKVRLYCGHVIDNVKFIVISS